MQDAKDTFYEVLRDRVESGNALRTAVVRGVVRPGVVVEENELPGVGELRDAFVMRWTAVKRMDAAPGAIAAMTCEVRYRTAGTKEAGGLDRGRALAAMDAELCAAVNTRPQHAAKKDFSALASGGAAVAAGSRIWWSDVALGAAEDAGEVLERAAVVTVWSFA